MKYFLSGERLILKGDKDVMLQGDETVIRVTKRGVYNKSGGNVWVRCKEKIWSICLVSGAIRDSCGY